MKTRLTSLLNIKHPIMLAGMGGVAYSDLVAAVSNAGGFGCLGASTMSVDQLGQEISSVRSQTAGPFGVDLLTALPGTLDASVELLLEGGASLFVAGLGVPSTVIERCHHAGVLVASMCGKVDHARRAVDAGCDLVIAQGTEAGGHTGSVATMVLVPLVVDAVSGVVPVVAAGGISDGRGLAAALCMGADGVWVGTRFIASLEARSVKGFKEGIVAARETDTTVSKAFSGKTMRVLKNDTTEYFEAHPEEVRPFTEQLGVSINGEFFHLGGTLDTPGVDPSREGYPAGQVVGAIKEVLPASQIIQTMVAEAEVALNRAQSTF